MTQSVGQVIVDAIRGAGSRFAFCVPGESYLSVLDAFNDVDDVELVTTHHEEGAGFMADAYAKATNRPGVALVTRGPGVTHLAIALHVARQDSTPLVALVGQVPTGHAGRESFQELDLVAFGDTVAKAGIEITDPDRAAEAIQRAFFLARSGRPGPVVVSLPEDVGLAHTEYGIEATSEPPVPAPDQAAIAAAAAELAAAPSVALIAGGGVLAAGATDQLRLLAEEIGCPVYAGWRRFDVFPNDHPQFAGNLPWLPDELRRPLLDADVVLALGTRLGDFSSLNYQLPTTGQRLVQLDIAASSMYTRRAPDIGIVADCRAGIVALRTELRARTDESTVATRRAATEQVHDAYLATTVPPTRAVAEGDVVDVAAAMATLRDVLPDDAAITCDAGSFSGFLNRFFGWRQPGTFYGTTAGAMGYAVPAALGAKLADRTRPVIAIAGDGGFTMTMSEVHTAVRLGLAGLVFVVFDNGTYGTIRQHQQRRFPGRVIGVDQGSADLAQVARGLGADAYTVTDDADLAKAVLEASNASGPAVVHVRTSPAQIDAWAR